MFFENLETERLVLKNIGFEDRDFLLKEFSDEEINRFLFDAEPFTCLEDADELIGFYLQEEPRAQHRWVITDRETGEKIGTCGFHCWDWNKRTAEVGYDLQSAFWSKGLMWEAMRAVLAQYLTKMDLRELYAHIYTENEKSICLAKKLGFVYSGKKIPYTFHGKEYLHYIYVLRREITRGGQ